MPKKRSRPRHPPQSTLEQFFTGLKDTVLDFVEDAAYDFQESVLRQQQGAGQVKVPPLPPSPVPKSRPEKRPRTGRDPATVPVPTFTPYSTLGVAPDAPQEVIQAAYRALSRIYHPDVPKTGNSIKMQRINSAYEVVGDVKKRKEYDWGPRP